MRVTMPPLAGRASLATLANGLRVGLLPVAESALVTSAVFYRAGTRDEPAGQAGIAHFLEHMMFKGSARYGPGEIDRRTQQLGGQNNAFTAHDVTAYHFSFAADRWKEALAIEADRMRGLRLDPSAVAAERQVILEEISMYDDEPWDALELAVLADFYGEHPYGRPVLGTREDLAAMGAAELGAFHRRHYEPRDAVLVVAGGFGADALDAVRGAFADLPCRDEGDRKQGGPSSRRSLPEPRRPRELRHLERQHGEVARLFVALPAPAGDDADHALLRLVATVLTGGRASRLHRALVEERHLCLEVSADVHETQSPGVFTLGFELMPGAEPPRVEAAVLEALAALRREPPTPAELERARQVWLADWAFGHERVAQKAMSIGLGLALFDLRHADRTVARIAGASAGDLVAVARRYLDADAGSVFGWSLPESS
jgi:zinc protease